MQSRWNDADAAAVVARLGGQWGEDLALRVYTSCLIGADKDLVLHGGGNTSVKTEVRDILGAPEEMICVKGSGCDLASIEPHGLPALRLSGLRRLAALETLTDDDLINQLRTHQFDASAPNPSVETLMHAFLPDRFVDHTHADASLVFGNRPEGMAELTDVLGAEVGVLPWIMPGLALARAVAQYRDKNPTSIGLVLHGHGVCSWGPDARTSYERHIQIVHVIERAIAARLDQRQTILSLAAAPEQEPPRVARNVAPILRCLLAASTTDPLRPQRPLVLEWRPTREALAAAASSEARALFNSAPLTPDHVIRTKGPYVVADAAEEELADAVTEFTSRYVDYFDRCSAGQDPLPRMLDPFPRVALVRGAGLLAWGKTKKDACIAADIAEHTIRGKAQAHALSSYQGLDDAALFEMEYWGPELAKLGASREPPLAGQVALVTGAAGAIGVAVTRRLLDGGAHVLVTDLEGEAFERSLLGLAETYGERVHGVAMDVRLEDSVHDAFDECVLRFGGLDVAVANAGIAHVAPMTELTVEDWERVQRVNETGVFLTFREAARVMKQQRLGGRLVLNASKNVPAPGADFVAYSASKAGAVQVARVAALELARHGILVNIVHPDGVFTDAQSGTSSGLWDTVGEDRMRSRGLTPEGLRAHYQSRNLLNIAVTADHVAEAVAFFAEGRTPTTGAALTVDGGLKETFYR